MRVRALVAAFAVLTGCGRVGFAPLSDAERDPTGGGPCVLSLSAGGAHTCAVSRDGGVWCWGDNTSGQIGDGATTTPRLQPIRVFENAVEVSAGGDHTCARNADGLVWCWGLNNRGQLGFGDTMGRSMPTTPISGLVAREISAGLRFSCARDDTTVWCWGHNFYGQLGDGAPGSSTNRPPDAYTPIQVINLPRPATALSAGEWHACARLDNDEVRCWGYNCCGQLGNNVFTPDSEEPYSTPSIAVPMLGARVSGGRLHSCAVTSQQTATCWGKGLDGALGYGGSNWQWSPIDVPGLTQIAELDSGGTHTCAVTVAGEVWCWGANVNGEVGDGSMMLRPTPIQLALTGAKQLSAGYTHVAAVIGDQIFTWGANASGQLGDDTTTPHAMPAASLFSCDGV
ncbi:MAG TPA: hypothetical protein VIV11_05505 [Kofleriaceae bacterium]